MKQKISPFALGFFVAQVGMQMQVIGINWQLYEITRSAFSLGLVGFFGFLPILLFSLIGGITADKLNRQKILIAAQIFQALFALILALTTYLGVIKPSLIYLILFLNNIAIAFNAPARQAIIPSFVPKAHFMNAVSLNTTIRQTSTVIGPAIGGFIIEFLGVKGIYVFNVFSFIFAIITLISINIPQPVRERNVSYSFSSVWEAVKFIRKSQILYSTMLLDFLATFFSSTTTLLPIFAKEVIGTGAKGLGILYAAPAIGGVIAGVTIASLGHIRHQGKIILGSILVYGLATIGFGLSRSFIFSFIFLALIGAGDITSSVVRNTIRQLLTPDYIRGRMVAVNMIFVQGGPQLGEVEAGILAALTSAPFSVVSGGILTVLAALVVAAKIPKLRRYHKVDIEVVN
ncbi:MFS transporter [Candidatus Daviesbacteria bacterium]|nr:MFS transporter [Candidatus Daviesbacteria bacterium]